jgi:hypothetical protein
MLIFSRLFPMLSLGSFKVSGLTLRHEFLTLFLYRVRDRKLVAIFYVDN